MTKDEFIKATDANISDSEWDIINVVYTFHPSISETEGKRQIAYLYSNFGMRLIRDMEATARRAAYLEGCIRQAQSNLDNLTQELKELIK